MTGKEKRVATAQPDEIEVGEVWASTHSGDVAGQVRQRRIVTDVEWPHFVWLQTEGGRSGSTRVRLNNGRLPGHRLVESAPSDPAPSDTPQGASVCPTCGSEDSATARSMFTASGWCEDPFHDPASPPSGKPRQRIGQILEEFAAVASVPPTEQQLERATDAVLEIVSGEVTDDA